MKILIFGKFDILHPGHIFLINQAKAKGEVTAVLESDQAIKRHHNFLPFYNQDQRAKELENFGLKVYLRQEQTYTDILDDLQPDFLYLGHDQELLLKEFTAVQNSQSYKFDIKIIKDFHPELFKSSRLRSVLADKNSGIYLLDKNKGLHSFRAVSLVRKTLGIKKVGFAGTLDPLASGLLILATGPATRLLDWFHTLPKSYIADILFGQTSDTYDLEGKVIANTLAKEFSRIDLDKILAGFLGKQNQRAPIFSAKKIAGQKLHELARKGQTAIAPSKQIEIYDLKILEFKYPKLKLEVSVSAGTYIRSLAHDLGVKTKTGALLADLRRTKIGDFNVNQALGLDKISVANLADAKIEVKDIIKSLNQSFRQ